MNEAKNAPSHLPAQGYGFLAARINGHGGKEALSDAIYDTPEEAEAGARSIIMSIEDHDKKVKDHEKRIIAAVDYQFATLVMLLFIVMTLLAGAALIYGLLEGAGLVRLSFYGVLTLAMGVLTVLVYIGRRQKRREQKAFSI